MSSSNDLLLRRLAPSIGDGAVSVDQAYAAPLGEPIDHDGRRRPWLGLSMVTSIDGSTAVAGRSRSLSNPTDAAVLGRLRRLAGVVLVGAGTVRAEGYGQPADPRQRIGVVTRRGNWIDPASALFAGGAGFLVTLDDVAVPDGIDVIRAGASTVDLAAALTRLDEVCDVAPRFVSVEGGGHLNGALHQAGLIDEIDVTISPKLAGGDGPRLTTGAAELLVGYDLRQLCVDDRSFVYLRWEHRR